MAHKKSLQALEITMRDIRKNDNLFDGALILLAGDFRQTLPVIPRSTPADELNACLKLSPLWRYVKVLRLRENVRVQLQNDPSAAVFSKQLLDIGNGAMAVNAATGMITFPENFCRITQEKDELVQSVFPNIVQNYMDHDWLGERAILAGTNKDVTELNWSIQSKIPGDVVSYKSIDTVTNDDGVVHYSAEFLNSVDVPGLPPHNLRLKLMKNVIEATILKGKFKGEDVLISPIPMIPTDMPFSFKRLQFPIRIAFAITINKSQGQSMEICGINLEYPVFSHGQLYVTCSRVGKPQALYIYAKDSQTKNIVYRKALN
ncbi:ATP-dependent DNA helicase pif1-like [Sitodiplosis mosellana]|uniref:ATP-dependent DNA helicase pif1-like n=1 Tax=Sitodiplosis mosellana TaxID=263140 RepID=UPI002445242B|nr:ATP-dependent DNA helicase pif1-like [Sitodiplosis mosellana]